MRRQHLTFFAVMLVIVPSALTSQLRAQCGVERWSVKTGTDSDAGSVNLNSASPTTVATLVKLSAPQPIPPNSRVQPTETTLWTMSATLVEFKQENDSDYHLVLSDNTGNTMIAEIPSPNCVAAGSPFAAGIASARSQFDGRFSAGSSFQQVNMPVQITGVAMFDFLHGQTGVAPNGIELHPVLKIDFGGLSVSAVPSALSAVAGSTVTTTISLSASANLNASVSCSVTGLASGLDASTNPPSITPPASATLTITIGQSVAPGNYSLGLDCSGGGSSASTPIVLTVNSSSTADFSISASPSTFAVVPGIPASATIASAAIGTFASDVTLSVSGVPAGLTASLNPSTVPSPGTGSSTLSITADPSATSGNASFEIVAAGGGTTHQAAVAVNVCTAPSTAISNQSRLEMRASGRQYKSAALGSDRGRDDDDGQIRILPSESALKEYHQHGGEPVCNPVQVDIFLGSAWKEPSYQSAKAALARIKGGLRAPAICSSGAQAGSVSLIKEQPDKIANVSDLQIQKRLSEMLVDHQLQPPTARSIYVVLLAPGVRSSVGQREAARDYVAYHSHFHSEQGEVRYIVIPYDREVTREEHNVSKALLDTLISPDASAW